jgi:GDPmannose 4,6-dehydratase
MGFTPGDVVLKVDPRYYRPTEVESLLGDPRKAFDVLGWRPRVTFPELVHEMVREDLDDALRTDVLRKEGFEVREPRE